MSIEKIRTGADRERRHLHRGNRWKLRVWNLLSSIFVFCVASTVIADAQTFNSLVSFNVVNGAGPGIMSLVQGTDGNLYGTTGGGGSTDIYGEIFNITPSGTLTVMHSFLGADGSFSVGGVIQASDGNFYGTTEEGGAYGPWGTVFKMTPDGALTTLHSFCAQTSCTDGQQPDAGLVEGTNGNLYGTTQLGGAHGSGTIFKITSGGKLTTLYSFCSQANCADGYSPDASLVRGADGNVYGTTINTFFRITPAGKFTTIYTFSGSDGIYSALIQAKDGNFYGVADSGGTKNAGTVFKITTAGVLTTLYNFCSLALCTDGNGPYGSLVQATDGNFYGTTYGGGAKSDGTVFKITPKGSLTSLYSFCPQTECTDGQWPYGGLVQATDGTFYGTTSSGGTDSEGTVFSLSTGLGPFVETRPAFGAAGSSVKILGTNLSGATRVTFNGKVASFKVVSGSEITTTVPQGATTGTVKVTTPTETLSSNVAFRVTK
jgi:uncharacterized repeat protein (TIGR03803 family)